MAYAIHGLTPPPGHPIQIGLAVCLLPALLVVLAVGAFGALVLAARGLFCGSVWHEFCALREKVGQEIFRA
jgi:hypothetical protein